MKKGEGFSLLGLLSVATVILMMAAKGSAQSSSNGNLPPIKTVFIILEENHNWSEITPSRAPYIWNTLVPMGAHAEQYYNPPGNHPSEPNYIWLEAGSNLGITNDSAPSINHQSTPDHFVTYLKNAGISWKSYAEDIDGKTCPLTSVNQYAPKHTPFVFFDDVTGTNNPLSAYCIAHIRPYAELADDLQNNTVASYNFITPNLCDDMHDCSVTAGDAWLSTEVPKILASQAYKDGGALFITWDEGDGSDGPIGMIVLSPFAKTNYSNSIHYTHSSTLRTLEEIFGVTPLLRDAANATDLSDLLGFVISNPTPGLTSISPSSVTAGGASFTLTLAGTNFVSGSAVEWNGAPRTTTFVSSTQLTASVPAGDIASAGSVQVTVLNPTPGGGASNALIFTVTAAVTVPTINPGGIVNNASYAPGSSAVAPGTIVAIFGNNLTDGTSCLPPSCNPTFGSNGKLNTSMTGAQVTVNGIPAPIFYSSPVQLGIEIPTELTGTSATVQVTVNGKAGPPQPLPIGAVSPGIFSFTADGKGAGAITHADGSPVTAQSPAHAGELVVLYATGLGQVTPPVPTGALSTIPSVAVAATVVSIDGISVIPDFSGLSGCCVGLNQVNFRLPANTRSANNIPVALSIAGIQSNTVTIAVQ